MSELPTHWLSLVAVVFLLGLKHGLDPDHLAAIDGLTRFNAQRRPRLSRWTGLLFSAGLVTGEALVGILLAFPIAFSSVWPSLSGDPFQLFMNPPLGGWPGLGALILIGMCLARAAQVKIST